MEKKKTIINMAVGQTNRRVVELILEHGRSIFSTVSIEAILIWALKEQHHFLLDQTENLLSEKAQELTRLQELMEFVSKNNNIPLANFLLKFESSKDIRDSHGWTLEQIVSAFQLPLNEGEVISGVDDQHLSPSRWDPARTPTGLELLNDVAHHLRYTCPTSNKRQFLTALADHPVPMSSKLYFEIEIIKGNEE